MEVQQRSVCSIECTEASALMQQQLMQAALTYTFMASMLKLLALIAVASVSKPMYVRYYS